MVKPLPVCPGRMSVGESLATLQANSSNSTAIKTSGNCLLTYYVEGKKRKESFRVTLLANPPQQIYLQGDVKFDAKGIVLGANEKEFWLAVKPKEISTYWWGQWSQVRGSEGLMISPRVLMDAVGLAPIASEDDMVNWSLSNEGPYDILTQQNDAGLALRKIYVSCCDYLVRKIEYFDDFGQPEVIVELDKYEEVTEGFSVATSVKVVRYLDGLTDSVKLSLSRAKPIKLNGKQIQVFFNPPAKLDRFKYKRELVDDEWIDR